MEIKCLKPVILLNPEARKKAFEYDRVYIRNRPQCWIIETFVLEPWQFAPRKWSIKPSDLESCYLLDSITGETLPLYIAVPCGSCIICCKRKAGALATRAIMETESCGSAPLFITLTYNNEHLPKNEYGYPTLRKSDLQLFFKRLRSLLDNQNISHSLRYLACGEYGSHTKRPHYHLLLWGFPLSHFKDIIKAQSFIQKAWSYFQVDENGKRIPYYSKCRTCPFNQYVDRNSCSAIAHLCSGTRLRYPSGAFIYRRYPIGSIKVLPANSGAPAYITKYMVKGSNAPHSTCEPPFRTASNRGGGIGSAYIRDHKDVILNNPSLEALPVVDRVTGSCKTFFMPIDSWVKHTLIPSPSSYLKTKEYETVRDFCYTFSLFEQCAQQLYRLYPMDRFIDGELQYYTDEFCDPMQREKWAAAYAHVREYTAPAVPNINIGNWIKTRELFNEYMYTLTERLDILARKVLEIDIDDSYFRSREQYLKTRVEIFKQKYANKTTNLEALAENIALSIERNRWKEYF